MRRPVVFQEASNADDELLIHHEGVLFTAHEAVEPVTDLKMVQQCGDFVPFSDQNLIAKLFPHLFTFRYGYPRTERKVAVSLQQCMKHYLSIYSRICAQENKFPLKAFYIVSRKRAMGQISLMC